MPLKNIGKPRVLQVDTDFSYLRRHEVIEYVTEKYGAEQVSQIITFTTLSTKSALKDIGRALGIDHNEINEFNKLVPTENGEVMPISDVLETIPEFEEYQKKYPRLFELALEVEGMPKSKSTHACGILITAEPITNSIALAKGKDGPVTNYEGPYLEKQGFIKFDFLGLKNLSVIEICVELVNQRHGIFIDINNLEPEEDSLENQRTYELIKAGQTDAVFQIESEGMKKMFTGMNDVNFHDLIAGVALYRPGPMAHIPTYISRKNGQEEVEYPCKEVEDIASNTFGILCYQEQIMQLTGALAGYTPGGQDAFRKAIGKKSQKVMDEKLPELHGQILEHGYSKEIADWAIEAIAPFVGYGFNKSHAAAYALIAYQTAYLKANYPIEYMTALLQVFYDDKKKVVRYANATKKMGFDVLTPDVNDSDIGFTIDGENAIRFGLGSILGLGDASIDAILEERKNGRFSSIKDIIDRIPKKNMNKTAVNALCYSGAFDRFIEEEGYPNRFAFLQRIAELRGDVLDDEVKQQIQSYIPRMKFDKEREVLGLYVSGHVLDRLAEPLDWEELNDGTQFTTVVLMEAKRIRTKKGTMMAFLTVDTLEGEQSITLFPQQYEGIQEALVPGMILKVGVAIQMNWSRNQTDAIVRSISAPKKINKEIWKKIDAKNENEEGVA